MKTNQPSILVLGALGNVGSEVAASLIARGEHVRVADLFPEKLTARYGNTAQAVRFDFADPSTYEDTFKGIQKVFLMRPPQISNIKKMMVPALNAAQQAGVRHVVFLSLIGIEKVKFVPHYQVEQYLRASSMTWTFLRCSFFMQNLNTAHLAEIRDRDEIFIPVADAKTSFIDVRDIGAAAAAILSSPANTNAVYDLTGPESLNYYQVAQALSSVLGRKITYANPTSLQFLVGNLRRHAPFLFTLVQTFLYTSTKSGMADVITADLPELLGRDPISFAQYAQDTCAVWQR